ncbi:esterase [Bhargavaea cecembensis DSE10]|uniref:Esterase n=1 Tax=Bhargavaea cecembensis DSE10 TaxID=1235279 RepID=M7NHF9_9BACL|nr:prolyl oligopeptidase family serine peptidase [Bhargavaea cecembensis]EMR07993.1 esterase [Bhargavaea cecembensis DSE10]
MEIREEQWAGIPLLHIYPETGGESSPVVIFLHGFTSAKEHNLHYAYNMAKRGLRVILPEAHLHGEREEGLDEVQLSLRFWEIVLTSIEEVGTLKEEIGRRFPGAGKFGLAGTSMGGIETLGCLKAYSWIDCAAVMMGTPGYVNLAKAQMAQYESKGFDIPLTAEERRKLLDTLSRFDLTKDRKALGGRPVYFWHGEQDETVPFKPTRNFVEAVREDYKEAPEKLKYRFERQAGHAVSRTGMLECADWLATYLNDDAAV